MVKLHFPRWLGLLAALLLTAPAFVSNGQALHPHNVYSDSLIRVKRQSLRTDTVGPTRANLEWQAIKGLARKVLKKPTVNGNTGADSLLVWTGAASTPKVDGYGAPYWQGVALQACAFYGRILQKPEYINAAIQCFSYQLSIRAADISTWRWVYGTTGFTEYAGAREGAWLCRLTIALDLLDSCMTTALVDSGKAFLIRGSYMLVHIQNLKYKELWPNWTLNNITPCPPGPTCTGWADSSQATMKFPAVEVYQLSRDPSGKVLTHVGGLLFATANGSLNNRASERMLGPCAVAYYTGESYLLQVTFAFKRLMHKYGQGPGGVMMEWADRNGDRQNPLQGVYYSLLSSEWLLLQAFWDWMNGSSWGYTYTTRGGYAGSYSPNQDKGILAMVRRHIQMSRGQNPTYWKKAGVPKYRLDFSDDSLYLKDGKLTGTQYSPYAAQFAAVANVYYANDTLKRFYELTLEGVEQKPLGYATAAAGGGLWWSQGGAIGSLSSVYIMAGGLERKVDTAAPPCSPTLSIVALQLINPDRDQVIRTIKNGEVITLAQLPCAGINIRVITCPDTVGSVEMQLVRILPPAKEVLVDNQYPYSLKGNAGLNFYSWLPQPGIYRLRLKAYSLPARGGTGGPPVDYTFTINQGVRN